MPLKNLSKIRKDKGWSQEKLAQEAKVSLEPLAGQPGGARLAVEDDGVGFSPAAASGGQLGLGIMRERAESVKAHLLIRSAPGEGTKVAVTWSPAPPT